MWLPTAGKIIGFINRSSFSKGDYVEIVLESHTGKRFTIDTPIKSAIGRKTGDAIFCNGDICVWHQSWESAMNRLNEVTKNK